MKPWVTALLLVAAAAAAAAGGALLWYFLRPAPSLYETIELPGSYGSAAQRAGLTRLAAGDVFWWWYPRDPARPVLLVLGGVTDLPASLHSLAALGPVDLDMNPRNDSWGTDYNLLFIDAPLGVGFSTISDPEKTPKNVEETAEHLLLTLRSFYSVHGGSAGTGLYLLGQGHGAQLALALAERLQHEDARDIGAALRGVALGNGVVAPAAALGALGWYLQELGYVDAAGRAAAEAHARAAAAALAAGRPGDAFDAFLALPAVVDELAGAVAVNLRRIVDKLTRDDVGERRDPGRVLAEWPGAAAHMAGVVGPALGLSGGGGGAGYDAGRAAVLEAFRPYYMIPAVEKVEYLLQNTNINITIYNGNLDAISNTPGQLEWVEALRWEGRAALLASPRRLLVVDRQLEGYVRETDRLSFYWVNAAGQSVPLDSPKAMRRILRGIAGY